MSVERRAARRATRGLCLAATAAIALAAVPTLHFNNTARVLAALLTNTTGCADGTRPSNSNFPFDAIVVPGAGVSFAPDGSHIPTDDGQTRLEDLLTEESRGIPTAVLWKERLAILSQLWDPTGKIQTLLGKLKQNNFWFHASLNPKRD